MKLQRPAVDPAMLNGLDTPACLSQPRLGFLEEFLDFLGYCVLTTARQGTTRNDQERPETDRDDDMLPGLCSTQAIPSSSLLVWEPQKPDLVMFAGSSILSFFICGFMRAHHHPRLGLRRDLPGIIWSTPSSRHHNHLFLYTYCSKSSLCIAGIAGNHRPICPSHRVVHVVSGSRLSLESSTCWTTTGHWARPPVSHCSAPHRLDRLLGDTALGTGYSRDDLSCFILARYPGAWQPTVESPPGKSFERPQSRAATSSHLPWPSGRVPRPNLYRYPIGRGR